MMLKHRTVKIRIHCMGHESEFQTNMPKENGLEGKS